MSRPAPVILDEVDSTSLELKRRVAEGCPAGTVIVARRQTAGYGQRGRVWSSDARGLYMSALLPMIESPTHLPFIVGLGCRDGLSPWTGEVGLKWVNDLVARRRKLGGMLMEAVKGQVIAGIGINLSTPDVEDAIGLAELTEAPPTVEALCQALLAGIDQRLATWQAHGFEPLRAAWSSASVTLGQDVRVTGPDPEVVGRAEALGIDGELLVRHADGSLATVISGTVRRLDGSYC